MQGLCGSQELVRPPRQLPDPELLAGQEGPFGLDKLKQMLEGQGLTLTCVPSADTVLSENQKAILQQAAALLSRWALP